MRARGGGGWQAAVTRGCGDFVDAGRVGSRTQLAFVRVCAVGRVCMRSIREMRVEPEDASVRALHGSTTGAREIRECRNVLFSPMCAARHKKLMGSANG